jgi:hypothetical protein
VAAYTYTGNEVRYYPGIGREVRPGDCVEWFVEPEDGRWEAVDTSAPAPARTASTKTDSAPAEPAPAVDAPKGA